MAELIPIFRDILLPVFILVTIGVAIGRRMNLEPTSLSKVAYYLLAPAFIFDILRRADIETSVITQMIVVMTLTTLIVALLAVLAGRLLHWGYSVTAAAVLIAVYGNVGNFGIPVVAFAFGDSALPLAGVSFLIINVAAFGIGVTAATWKKSSPARAIGTALTTPALLVVPFAMALNTTNTDLPLFADRAIGLMADAMIAVMLITLGLQLAAMDRPVFDTKVWVTTALRLVAAPVVAAVIVTFVGLEGDPGGVVILQSAMPAAVFTALIAIEHDLVPDFVTTTVLTSTLASAVTLSATLALL